MQRVLDAMDALLLALPNVCGLQVQRYGSGDSAAHFTINTSTEEKAHELAEIFGLTLKLERSENSTWLAGYGRVTVYGPHRRRTEAMPIDEVAVEAALAKAHEVLS